MTRSGPPAVRECRLLVAGRDAQRPVLCDADGDVPADLWTRHPIQLSRWKSPNRALLICGLQS
jgi:hypothetical protein